ncbi:MAG: ABC transporter [Terracidiphilus sp.]
MLYQLVIQFHPAGALDLEKLVAIEDALTHKLGDSASVDGHDTGSGEFNIFILTADPNGSFQRAQRLLEEDRLLGKMNVAYRDIDGEDYVILWPPNLTEFKIA